MEIRYRHAADTRERAIMVGVESCRINHVTLQKPRKEKWDHRSIFDVSIYTSSFDFN